MMIDSLDKLHDIYTPPLIGFEWMQGYNFIIIFFLSISVSVLYFYFSYILATRFKRAALKELETLKKADEFSGVFELIKRVLLTTSRREEVANLSDEALIAYMKEGENTLLLNRSIYNKNIKVSQEEKAKFYQDISKWIKRQEAIYD